MYCRNASISSKKHPTFSNRKQLGSFNLYKTTPNLKISGDFCMASIESISFQRDSKWQLGCWPCKLTLGATITSQHGQNPCELRPETVSYLSVHVHGCSKKSRWKMLSGIKMIDPQSLNLPIHVTVPNRNPLVSLLALCAWQPPSFVQQNPFIAEESKWSRSRFCGSLPVLLSVSHI